MGQKLNPGNGYTGSSNKHGFSLFVDQQYVAPTPFKVSLSGKNIYVYPGTINNLIPTINGTGLNNLLTYNNPQPFLTYSESTSNYYVYLEIGPASADSKSFPNTSLGGDGYPQIKGGTSVPSDTSTKAHILIATISNKGTSIYQHIFSSIMGERHKYTEPEAFSYYFWRL